MSIRLLPPPLTSLSRLSPLLPGAVSYQINTLNALSGGHL